MRVRLSFGLLAITLLLGCRYRGYQQDHSVRALHVFGIGWIRDRTGVRDISAFTVGHLNAGSYETSLNTNAPVTRVFQRSRAVAVKTNWIQTPLGISVQPP